MKRLGFEGLEEVAVGADLCAVEEAEAVSYTHLACRMW